MKILILSDYIENYQEIASFKIRYQTAFKMAERGHDVVFMSPSNRLLNTTKRTFNKRFKTITSPGLFPNRLRTGGFSIIDAICKTIVALIHDFDIIQVTNGHRPAQFIPCIVGKFLKKAVIIDECWEWLGKGGYADKRKKIIGKLIGFYDISFELLFKRFYDHIVTISTVLRSRFKNKKNITVLHGGTENRILRDYEITEARKELNLGLNILIFGMSNVCSSDHEDNDTFFKAFERVCQEYNNCFLLLTGSEENYIDEIGTIYSCSERLIFPGWVDFDIYNKYLSSCNIFVLPLKNTAINRGRWPNKIGDYLCLNRPVITNPTGDIKQLFAQYRIGILCDHTPEAFFHLTKQVSNKTIELVTYTEDSLHVANEVLSFDKRIDKYLEIFEEMRKKTASQAL